MTNRGLPTVIAPGVGRGLSAGWGPPLAGGATINRGLPVTFTAPQPPPTYGLDIWLDATTLTGLNDGDPVSTWTDQSGFGRHATQATASKQPTYRPTAINGRPAVRFDGVDDRLGIDKVAGQGVLTVFMVLRKLTVGSGYWTGLRLEQLQLLMRMGTAGDQWGTWEQAEVTSGAAITTTPTLITVIQTAGSIVDLITNGTLAHRTNGTGLPNSATDGQIGSDQSSSTQWSNIDIGELLVYQLVQPTSTRIAIEDYLRAKWAIS